MNMVKWLNNLFNHKCEHSWRVEDPLIDFGSNFRVWEGPIFERCIKCGERIEYSESAQTFLSDFDKALRELFQK